MKMNISDLINDKLTYPSWSTNKSYQIKTRKIDDMTTQVYYVTISGKIIKKEFPTIINMTPELFWTLGFIKGEGANALGKSNYRRFTLTNSDPHLLNFAIQTLLKSRLLKEEDFKTNCFNIMHAINKESELYWHKQLGFSKENYKFYKTKNKKTKNGVCHLYLSDVLLRRIIDELNNSLLLLPKSTAYHSSRT